MIHVKTIGFVIDFIDLSCIIKSYGLLGIILYLMPKI